MTRPQGEAPLAWPAFTRGEIVRLVLRILALVVVLFGSVALLSHVYRSELEALGRAFVDRLGYGGMTLGSFLADGLHLPIPPQLYMLLAVSSRTPFWPAFGAIVLGSMLGSVIAYGLSYWVGERPWLARRLARPRKLIEQSVARWGDRSALWASLMPIPYATLMYLTGLSRLPLRFFAWLCFWRIPRLLVYYGLVVWGWSGF